MSVRERRGTPDALDRGRRSIARLVDSRPPLADLFVEADRALRGLIAYDAPCWLSLDPVTVLPTAHYAPGSDAARTVEATRRAYLDGGSPFAALASGRCPVATLRRVADGHLERSGRVDGDEMRVLFRVGGSPWGGVILRRRAGVFTDGEITLMASLAPLLADGIRRSILTSGAIDENAAPGLLVLTAADEVEALTAPARRWIPEIVDGDGGRDELPLSILGIAAHARRVAAGLSSETPTARLPLRKGSWVIAHAATFEDDDGRVGVTLSPLRRSDLSAIIVEAYGLSPREREITRLVCTGLATDALARRLGISVYTVQDHLKSVFGKVGVHSRRELVAEVFFRPAGA